MCPEFVSFADVSLFHCHPTKTTDFRRSELLLICLWQKVKKRVGSVDKNTLVLHTFCSWKKKLPHCPAGIPHPHWTFHPLTKECGKWEEKGAGDWERQRWGTYKKGEKKISQNMTRFNKTNKKTTHYTHTIVQRQKMENNRFTLSM